MPGGTTKDGKSRGRGIADIKIFPPVEPLVTEESSPEGPEPLANAHSPLLYNEEMGGDGVASVSDHPNKNYTIPDRTLDEGGVATDFFTVGTSKKRVTTVAYEKGRRTVESMVKKSKGYAGSVGNY